MNCCQPNPYNSAFNPDLAAEELRHYQQHGPRKETRLLIDALRAQGVDHATLLDIGGGVGTIPHELLAAGASHATDVDASSPYLDAARQEAQRRGHADRVTFLHGDFVTLAPRVEPADIVTLDRVICCYPQMEALVRLSAQRARRLVGLVYPRDSWWIRLGGRLGNVLLHLTHFPIPIFVHRSAAVDAVLREEGLRPLFRRRGLIWQVVVYGRPQPM